MSPCLGKTLKVRYISTTSRVDNGSGKERNNRRRDKFPKLVLVTRPRISDSVLAELARIVAAVSDLVPTRYSMFVIVYEWNSACTEILAPDFYSCLPTHRSKMAFESLHYESCPYFGEQLQGSSDVCAAVVPGGRPPSEPPKKRKGPRKRLQQTPRRNKAADSFLRNAPKATEWRKRQTGLGLNTVEQYEQAIRAFTKVDKEPYQRDGYSEHELLAERFAGQTQDSLMNANQKSFSTFQLLILLSYCGVLRSRGCPDETIDQIIQHIGDREYDRRRLLRSARWINRLIVALVSHGWTIYRATELFFIGVLSKLLTREIELTSVLDALSFTYLTTIYTENPQSILKHLKTDDFVKHDYSDCLRPEYTIPGLIASLLDTCSMTAKEISYGSWSDDIGNADGRVLGLRKYATLLVTTLIAYQSQSRAYTKFILLLRTPPSPP